MFGGRACRSAGFLKPEKREGDCGAELIDPGKALFRLFIRLFSRSVRRLPPGRLSLPGALIRIPEIEIAGEKVTFLSRQAGKAAGHVADEIVRPPAVVDNVIGIGNHGWDRAIFQVRLAGGKKRNAVLLKGALQEGGIVVKAPNGNGNISPATVILSDRFQNLRGGKFTLRGHIFGPDKLDSAVRGHFPAGRGKEPVGKKLQRICTGFIVFHISNLERYAQLFRYGNELTGAAAGEGKNLIIPVSLIIRQTDSERSAAFHHGSENGKLRFGEINEAVHIDGAASDQGAFSQILRQNRKPVCRVNPAAAQNSIIGLGDSSKIGEFFCEITSAAGCSLQKVSGGNAG